VRFEGDEKKESRRSPGRERERGDFRPERPVNEQFIKGQEEEEEGEHKAKKVEVCCYFQSTLISDKTTHSWWARFVALLLGGKGNGVLGAS
jgi:hypothetical protein